MSRPRLVVIGGGIAGLAAAWEASEGSTAVTLLEASERLGGKIRTSPLPLGDGTSLLVDEGADAFLARVPDAVRLCHELGLDGELTQPAIGHARVLAGDELVPMPADTVLGVPLDPDQLDATGILSPAGVAAVRAEADAAGLPGLEHDVTIGAYLAGRFGPELVERLVGPLIGGINAGDVHELSLRAVTPQLAEAAAEGGSLSAALRRRRTPPSVDAPVFHALLGGTGRLVQALAEQLDLRGVELRTGAPVERVERTDDDYTVHIDRPDGPPLALDATALVLATPAPAAAHLLRDLSPDAAAELAEVRHSSVVLVTLVYDRDQVGGDLDSSGFLVPRDAGRFLTAASFGSSKWAHWDDGRHVVLRASAGHVHDDRPMHLSDDEVVERIVQDLEPVLAISGPPLAARVSRYPDGFAQYTVGHLDRVDRVEAALLRDQPAIRVAGAAYRGVGIPACIRQGRQAASELVGR